MNLVNQIVELIMSFIVDFLDKLKLRDLSEALGAKKKETDKILKEETDLYEEYKREYEAYKTDINNRTLHDDDHTDGFGYSGSSNLRPDAGQVQQSSSKATGNDKDAGRREDRAVSTNRRAGRHNRKTKQRKSRR